MLLMGLRRSGFFWALLLLLGCAGRAALRTTPPDAVVVIRDPTLSAPGLSSVVLTIASGQMVEWVNRTGHRVMLDFDRSGLKAPRFILPAGSARVVFPEAGTYAYRLHLATNRQLEKFEGRVVVLPDGSSPGQTPSSDLGLTLQDLTPSLARAFRVKEEKGVLMTSVAPGSQAEREGLREGDVVTAVNKTPVASVEAFSRMVRTVGVGEQLLLKVSREDRVFFVVLQPPIGVPSFR